MTPDARAGKPVRIANGSAFWGDSQEAPLELLTGGPLDYLTLDYLAEITMSILQKLRARDPRAGYAHDFVGVIKRGAREIVERGVKVATNAGGINPLACRDAVAAALQSAGYGGRVKTSCRGWMNFFHAAWSWPISIPASRCAKCARGCRARTFISAHFPSRKRSAAGPGS
jgi:hypothetical protein